MTTIDPAQSRHATRSTLFDLSGIDLSACVADREAIAHYNPHRYEMALLDEIIWLSDDLTCVLGRHNCGKDAFWVRGHYPGRPMMPGVLQVEAGAQLACYLWNRQQPAPRAAAFLRIEQAAFRRSVVPGEELLILCKEVKQGRRRFISDIQGVVEGQIAFETRVSGMVLDDQRTE